MAPESPLLALSQLIAYGGAYLFASVGIAKDLPSSEVQGLAHELHEVMVPFVIAGAILLTVEGRNTVKATGGVRLPFRRTGMFSRFSSSS